MSQPIITSALLCRALKTAEEQLGLFVARGGESIGQFVAQAGRSEKIEEKDRGPARNWDGDESSEGTKWVEGVRELAAADDFQLTLNHRFC